MPFSPKAHRLFALCATNPQKAQVKCPPKAVALRLMKEGVKHPSVKGK